jgi:hypothetical protein
MLDVRCWGELDMERLTSPAKSVEDNPTVWTGRALQSDVNKWRGGHCASVSGPCMERFVLLAIMDIRAHPISF